MEQNVTLVKVSKNSDVGKTAGAIAHRVRDGKTVEVAAAGSTGVHIAVKSIATAGRYVQEEGGFELMCSVKYTDISVNDDVIKGLSFIVERKQV